MNNYIKAPFGISITTYELGSGIPKATLTHTFWGETPDEAFGIAKSHLITDYFFSSSFIGEMPWNDGTLILNNKGELLGQYSKNTLNSILNELANTAEHINLEQVNNGILQVIESVQKSL